MKPRERKHANYVCFHKLILATSNVAKLRNSMCIFAVGRALVPTQEEKTICAHTRRKNYTCIGGKNLSDYSFKGKESLPI